MRYAIVDVETTTFKKGHPFAHRNKLCYIGIRIDGDNHLFAIEYGLEPYSDKLREAQKLLDNCDCVVGFNIKFDLHWLARYGITLSDNTRVYDLQLAEFLSTNQSNTFPSLEKTLEKYGLPPKSDVVEREYWAVGIDTDAIPRDVLEAYLDNDLVIEDNLYLYYQTNFPQAKERLLSLGCQDLRVLQEMEFNGIKFNWQAMEKASDAAVAELALIDASLAEWTDHWPHFNWSSGDHLSCLLYGGKIEVDVAIPYEHTYKGGAKAGQTETRNRWTTEVREFKQLVKPLPKTELKKEGYYSTDERVLSRLKKPRKLLELLSKRAEIEKINSTYYLGFQKKRVEFDWMGDFTHGQFNQCVVITGRLSSSNPNLQNMPALMDKYVISRFS